MGGHQPMWSDDGRYCITYNGEIYNFIELRNDLTARGHVFRTTSDTEVLLAGWQHLGKQFLPLLRGMFAFAIWDNMERQCHLARDEFGIKPLYIAQRDCCFLFASELRAVLASDLVSRRLDPEAVQGYLATGSVEEPRTIISGIRALEPGCVQRIDISGGEPRETLPERYTTRNPETHAAMGMTEGALAIRSVLRDSVTHHLLSDVPVGVFLSGGLDSAAIVALAAEQSREPVNTFTVAFSEKAFSEGERARRLAERFGTAHNEVLLSGKDLLNALPDVFAGMDQPTLDGVNTFVVSRAVRSFGLKVVLSGLGGDELFAGYPSFRRAHRAQKAWLAPAFLRRFAGNAVGSLSHGDAAKLKTLLVAKSPAQGAYKASRTVFGDQQIEALMPGSARFRGAQGDLGGSDYSAMSLLQQVSHFEISRYMRNTLLRDGDTFSMAHSLELRVPFVDKEVHRTAMATSDSAKLAPGLVKPLLFEAVKDLLPAEMRAERKQGFTLPFASWMREDLFDEVGEFFKSGRSRAAGVAAGEASNVWNDFLARGSGMSWTRPWALYTLARWMELNKVELPS
jgi:asparagine synthase (glutamine-hydrolysing)